MERRDGFRPIKGVGILVIRIRMRRSIHNRIPLLVLPLVVRPQERPYFLMFARRQRHGRFCFRIWGEVGVDGCREISQAVFDPAVEDARVPCFVEGGVCEGGGGGGAGGPEIAAEGGGAGEGGGGGRAVDGLGLDYGIEEDKGCEEAGVDEGEVYSVCGGWECE